jgi:hypothetical protein
MDPKEPESNWAHACRVLGLDWPGVMSQDRDGSTADTSGAGNIDVSSDLPGASVVVASPSRPQSAYDA